MTEQGQGEIIADAMTGADGIGSISYLPKNSTRGFLGIAVPDRRVLRLVAALCFLLIVFLAVAETEGEYIFGPTIRITPYPAGLCYGHLAVDADGDPMVLWVEDGILEVRLSCSYDGGESFDAGVVVDSGFFEAGLALAANMDNDIFLTWGWGAMPNYSNIVFTHRIAESGIFDPTQFVDENSAHAQYDPSLAVDPLGNPMIAWVDKRNYSESKKDIYFAKSIDGGQSFLSSVRIDSPPSNQFCPCLAVNKDGNPLVAYKEGPIWQWDLYLAYSTDGALTFPNKILIEPFPPGMMGCPILRLDSKGRPHVVWSSSYNPPCNLYLSRSSAYPEKFGDPICVDSLTWGGRGPDFAIDEDGNLFFVWMATDSSTGFVRHLINFSYSTDGGLTFSVPTAVDGHDSILEQQSPQIALGENAQPMISWSQWSRHGSAYICFSKGTFVGVAEEFREESDAFTQTCVKSYPEPFATHTTMEFTVPCAGRTSLSVYDTAGRKVRSLLTSRSFARGVHTLVWDGNGDNGVPCPSGVYFMRLVFERGGGNKCRFTSRRVTVLK